MAVFRPSHVLLLAALAAGARGGDPTPPPPAGGTADDSIAAAKRDFDAVKNSRATAESTRLDVPTLSTPALHLSGDEMSVFMQSQAAQKKKDKAAKTGKSENWLVDAMAEKKPDASGEARADVLPGEEADSELGLAVNSPWPSRSRSATASDAPKPEVNADNPLTTYMAAWMTPKDFDLLKVKTAESNFNAGPDRGGDRTAEPVGLANLARSEPLAGLGRTQLSGSGPETRPNPYLADFAPGPDAGVKNALSFSAPLPPSYLPPAPVQPIEKTELAPAKNPPPLNDLLKPSTDAKYFPQLKRF